MIADSPVMFIRFTSWLGARLKMPAFEHLLIVEARRRLVYVARPGDAAPTGFVFTELTTTRAVFENPRHDYPNRIMYESA